MKNPVPLHLLPFILFSSFLLSIFFLGTPVTLAETITLTTYYPSPFGAYDRMILVPRAALSGACTQGTIYYNTTIDAMEYCNSSLVWSGVPIGNWRVTGTNLYPSNLAWNVGIGTSSPEALLHVISPSETHITRVTNASSADFIGNLRLRIQRAGGFNNGTINAIEFNLPDASNVEAVNMAGLGAYFVNNAPASQAAGLAFHTHPAAAGGNPAVNMVLDPNGNLGIGTSNPPFQLTVNNGTAPSTLAQFIGSSGKMSFDPSMGQISSTGQVSLKSNGSTWDHAYIENGAGNDYVWFEGQTQSVGIQTNLPTQTLDVNGAVRIRGGTPGAGRVLTDIDGAGTGGWRDVVYSP